ncbi:MAG: DsbA family protein [Haloarculaceae archaeon]
MSETSPGSITIYSDYVCPFCYLGRQSLDQYQQRREDPLDIDWHPYDLRHNRRGPDGEIDPDADDGKDDDYFQQVRQNVRKLQDRYGVEMTQEVATDVDSLNAQIASVYVDEQYPDQWRAFDEAIFAALWTEGRDIGDPDVLADLAADCGLDPEEIRDAIADEDLRERLTEQFAAAQQRGITGVPTFVYGEHAARGAVPPEHLERLVEGA